MRWFWEIEDHSLQKPGLSPEEKAIIKHLTKSHERGKEGRFIVLPPRTANITPLSDSRIQALRKFKVLERSLRTKGTFDNLAEVTCMNEYLRMGHTEQIPLKEVDSPRMEVY